MNIKRGINRIAIILAIISALFGFYFGADKYDRKNTTRVIVFTDNFRSYMKDTFLVNINKTIPPELSQNHLRDESIRSILEGYPKLSETISFLSEMSTDPDRKAELIQNLKKIKTSQIQMDLYFKHDPLTRYRLDRRLEGNTPDIWKFGWSYPPTIQTIIIGLKFFFFSFLIVFFSIHGVFRLSRWIKEGFTDKK